jgi:hypothetical protein
VTLDTGRTVCPHVERRRHRFGRGHVSDVRRLNAIGGDSSDARIPQR